MLHRLADGPGHRAELPPALGRHLGFQIAQLVRQAALAKTCSTAPMRPGAPSVMTSPGSRRPRASMSRIDGPRAYISTARRASPPLLPASAERTSLVQPGRPRTRGASNSIVPSALIHGNSRTSPPAIARRRWRGDPPSDEGRPPHRAICGLSAGKVAVRCSGTVTKRPVRPPTLRHACLLPRRSRPRRRWRLRFGCEAGRDADIRERRCMGRLRQRSYGPSGHDGCRPWATTVPDAGGDVLPDPGGSGCRPCPESPDPGAAAAAPGHAVHAVDNSRARVLLATPTNATPVGGPLT